MSLLIVGDLMLDRYITGSTSRISPEAPVPIVKIQKEQSVPGGAGNVALNIMAMGTSVSLLGLLGRDAAGENLKQLLSHLAINGLFQYTDLPTITKSRIISQHQQMLRLDHEKSFELINKETLVSQFEQILSQHKAVILSDYGKGTLSNPQAFIQIAKSKNIPVFVDPKGSDFSKYKDASVITPNYSEFITVVGPCKTEEEIISKAQNLIKKLNLEALLITRSADGMSLIFPESSPKSAISIPTEAQEVFDVTGAGDTVIAHFALAITEGHDFITAMKIANKAAGIVVGKLGAATVSREELAQTPQSFVTNTLTEEEAIKIFSDLKAHGSKTVFTNGCFDLLHSGHLTYLKEAKSLGDYLLVAVNTDESIRKLKGPSRPIIPLKERMEMLAALKFVDGVIAFSDDTPTRLLALLKPDILVKGGDYPPEKIVGWELVKNYGGEVKTLSFIPGQSTSHIIQRIQLNPSS